MREGFALGAVDVLYDAARAALYGLPYFFQSCASAAVNNQHGYSLIAAYRLVWIRRVVGFVPGVPACRSGSAWGDATLLTLLAKESFRVYHHLSMP